MRINEKQLRVIIRNSLLEAVSEVDRHRPGYWAERWAKQKARNAAETGDEKQAKPKTKKRDRHRPGYYREYNAKHPERLNRGYTKGYVDGCVANGRTVQDVGKEIFPGVKIIGYDEIGRPITNDSFYTHLLHKRMEWHDDDWSETDSMDESINKINEKQLRTIIRESINKVLTESNKINKITI